MDRCEDTKTKIRDSVRKIAQLTKSRPSLNELEKTFTECVHVGRNLSNQKAILQTKINNYEKDMTDNRQQLHSLSEQLKTALASLDELKKEEAALEKELQSSNKSISSAKEQLKALKNPNELHSLSKTVKAYQILTGTNLVFCSNDCEGYVHNKASGKLKAFSISSKKGKKAATEKLWKVLEETTNP